MKNQGKKMFDYRAILESPQAVAFRLAVSAYGMYCLGGITPPHAVEKLHKECLQRYRDFLDELGIHMSVPNHKVVSRERK